MRVFQLEEKAESAKTCPQNTWFLGYNIILFSHYFAIGLFLTGNGYKSCCQREWQYFRRFLISIAQSVVQDHTAFPVCLVIGETADTYNESGKSMLDKDTIEYRIGDSVITVRRYFSRERTRKLLIQEIIADQQAVWYNSNGNTAVVPIQKEGS